MLQKIPFIFMCMCCVCNAFAIDCQNSDEKLITLDGKKLGTSMYNQKLYANENGDWAVGNKQDDNFKAIGSSLCLNSDIFKESDILSKGPFCWCKVDNLDNYRVLSDYYLITEYRNHVAENKNVTDNKNVAAKRLEENAAKLRNTNDCKKECSSECQSKLTQLVNNIIGYYVCDKSLYKLSNVICAIGDELVKVQNILVFEDSAEISMKYKSIIFKRDTDDKDNMMYTGTYDYFTVYLKVENDKIYVGNKLWDLQECM